MTPFAAATSNVTTTAAGALVPKKKLFSPWALLPGLLFWSLIGAGFYTEDTRFFSVAVAVAALAIVSRVMIARRRSSEEKAELKRIWQEGTPRQAEILAISSNGGMNRHPRVDFELDVVGPSGARYHAQTSVIVDKLAIPRIQPGTTIGVRVDPRDPSRVLIDEALTYLKYER